jgi:predicted TIM-barrel fold metal-dependent hydrolase
MKIIDAHVHFWDLNNKINNWVSRQTNLPFLNKNYLPGMLPELCEAGLYGVVHIEAHDSFIPTVTEIQWLDSIMQDNLATKYRHIAFVDITLPAIDFISEIKQIKEYKNVIGVRHIMAHHPDFGYSPCAEDLSNNSNILQNLIYLTQNHLIFDCQMYPYQINNILPAIIASKVITLIDHLALPTWNTDGDKDHKAWAAIIIKLALIENIFIKVSGLDMFKKESDFDIVVAYVLKNYPIKHLIYGSNYPVSFNHDYNFWHKYLDKFNLSFEEKDNLFFKNAYDVFFNNIYLA